MDCFTFIIDVASRRKNDLRIVTIASRYFNGLLKVDH
jgi:hypothetical protein